MSSDNQENRAITGALTYPVSSSDAVQPAPVQPRQPRNLQGLLKFAMEATKAEDALGNSQLGPMDEERRKFLQEALKSVTVNIVEVLQDSMKVLTDAEKMQGITGPSATEEVLNAFNNLLEFVDDIDIANDFYKMGGFQIFPIAFGCTCDEVRLHALTLLAELCQNNPYLQAKVLETGLLNVLMNLAQKETDACLAKSIYALSSCTRQYEPACKELTEQGGCLILAEVLMVDDADSRTKAAFFIRYLCQHYTPAKEEFIKLNIVRIIADQLKQLRDFCTEHLLGTLLALLEGLDPRILKQCRDPQVGLRQILENLLKDPQLVAEPDRYREEIEYSQELLNQLFVNYTQPETETDVVVEEADR